MSEPIHKQAVFATTHWSVVLAAGDAESPEAAAALEVLCRGYWFPLYAHARRAGNEAATAEHLTLDLSAPEDRDLGTFERKPVVNACHETAE